MNLLLIWVLLAVFIGAICNGSVGFLIAHAAGEPFQFSKFLATIIRAFASSVLATAGLSFAGTDITVPVLLLSFGVGYGMDAGLHDISVLSKGKPVNALETTTVATTTTTVTPVEPIEPPPKPS